MNIPDDWTEFEPTQPDDRILLPAETVRSELRTVGAGLLVMLALLGLAALVV